ncbi:MAG: hypothetical protein KAQ68_06760 [Clostridiales bacterium]|nr:hypothetical protein [Clostridiales bacterium]
MKRKSFVLITLALCITLMLIFSGCSLLNKVPEKYTEGIRYDRDYPDDALEIYDDAIVYDSRVQFGDIVLSCGTTDDIDDIIDFYRDFFEDNGIILDEETEDRDEYCAKGISEEYSFKVQVEEADGEIIEDIFEYIILLSITPLTDEELNNVQQTPPQETATPEVTPTPIAEVTPEPPVEVESIPLTELLPGTYQLIVLIENNEFLQIKSTIHIDAAKNGTMFYFDYYADERWMSPFSYTIIDGIISLNLNNDISIQYTATMEDNLVHFKDDTTDLYYADWHEVNMVEAAPDEFTAFGCWMFYDPNNGHTEIISFWPNGGGYVYNWGGTGESRAMYWEYDSETRYFTFLDQMDMEVSYEIVHKGEVFELHQTNGSVFFYDRLTPDILPGLLFLEDSSEEGLERTIYFNANGIAEISTTRAGKTVATESEWYINASTGSLHMDIDGEIISYDYHFDPSGLFLVDYEYGYYYQYVFVG